MGVVRMSLPCGSSLSSVAPNLRPRMVEGVRTDSYVLSVRALAVAVFVVLLLAGAGKACAQQFSGVTGVVSDISGGVIVGAKVTLDNLSVGFHQEATTNDVGS